METSARPGRQTLLFFLTVAGLVLLVYHLSIVFLPLLIAFLLTYIWNPVVNRLQERMPRLAAIAIVYVAFIAGLTVLGLFGVPALAGQGLAFVEEGFTGETLTTDQNGNGMLDTGDTFVDTNGNGRWDPPKYQRAMTWAETSLHRWLGDGDLKEMLKRARERLRGEEKAALPAASELLGVLFTGALSGIKGLIAVLSFFVLVPVYLFFLLKSMDTWYEKFTKLVPEAHRVKTTRVLGRIHAATAAFYRGQIIISLIEGTIIFVAFSIMGVKLAFFFGVMYAVLAMVPFLGVLATFGLSALFVIADTGFGTQFFLVCGLFASIQLLESFALQPLILGRETGLHPMVIILAILIFGNLFGFVGVLLAVPLASATLILGEEYLLPALHGEE